MELVCECEIRCLWHDTLFVEEAEDSNRTATRLDEIDGRLEIKAEIDVVPLDTLSRILLLLEDEHVVVEELLQLLVRVVDAELFETVDLELDSHS